MESSLDLLKTLSETDGAPGYEEAVRARMEGVLSGAGRVIRDRVGGFVCEIAGATENPRVLLDAHLDEVGFMVQHITGEGFLKFVTLGGWWKHVLPGVAVRVRSRSGGTISGTITASPPHQLSGDKAEKMLGEDELAIDIGAMNREEALSWGIDAGAPVTPATAFSMQPNGKTALGKAFDDRVGCALAVEAALRLGSGHPNMLLVAGSAQEETGCRGTRTTCHLARPDVAIVLEGPPADDVPGLRRDESQGALGGGVQIRRRDPSAMMNPRLCDLAVEIARERGIAHQVAVRRTGGTDAKEIHLFETGVPTIVLGVPVRYIHSPTGVLHVDDYRAALELTVALVERLDEKTVAGL